MLEPMQYVLINFSSTLTALPVVWANVFSKVQMEQILFSEDKNRKNQSSCGSWESKIGPVL